MARLIGFAAIIFALCVFGAVVYGIGSALIAAPSLFFPLIIVGGFTCVMWDTAGDLGRELIDLFKEKFGGTEG